MTDAKISEVMEDSQLEAVTGGTNMESVALLMRISNEGLAQVYTNIVPGNEKAAAKELAQILKDNGFHGRVFMNDEQTNIYEYNGERVSADEVINIMRKNAAGN